MLTHLRNRLLRLYGLWKTAGFAYVCPLCDWHARHFYAAGFDYPVLAEYRVIGAGRRDNVRCPSCNSSTRERLIYLYLTRETDVFTSAKNVFHVAPERSLERIFRRAPTRSYLTADIDGVRGELKCDISAIPLPDQSYDLVICSHVLEHVPDDRKAMRELLRILRPGGLAILQVPFSPLLAETREDPTLTDEAERIRRFGQNDHIRMYGTDYPRRLRESGFVVDVIPYAQICTETERRRYALDEKEPLFICKRPL